MSYTDRYQSLNAAQKQAVDTIDGPVMVVAGPGTGKTELLSVRVATILQRTDTLPENILCLTFTESGASAMRERLAGIIGKAAYKVAIHTFHSFGTEVINQNGKFFYQGAQFQPADELSTYEIIKDIFDELPYDSPLASTMNGEYTHLGDVLTTISELKKSGLTNDELLAVLAANEVTLDLVEAPLAELFAARISKTTADALPPIIDLLVDASTEQLPGGIPALAGVLRSSLQHAVAEAAETNSTKPVTAWRNTWMKKNDVGAFSFKTRERQAKLRVVASIYFQYLTQMQESELYDFDDMILRVTQAIELFDELRFNLQEKFQYIMVDEFQDTNMAQMRIIQNLTNNTLSDDAPNIMVVGDDDQAIYSFQGADISNILNFRETYHDVTTIALTDNYRSTAPILAAARTLITQAGDRLEDRITSLSKELTAHSSAAPTSVEIHVGSALDDERLWLVQAVRQALADGTPAAEIAVLARRHHEIAALLPYFTEAGIAVTYERRDNVLALEPIVLLQKLAMLLLALSQNEHDTANALLPEILAHPAFQIAPLDLWRLSTRAYQSRTHWLEVMEGDPLFAPIQHWLVELTAQLSYRPLEQLLDLLVGHPSALQAPEPVITAPEDEALLDATAPQTEVTFSSPLYEYFFGQAALAADPSSYLRYLEGLRTIRTKLREYLDDDTPTLGNFIAFIQLHDDRNVGMSSVYKVATSDQAIHLMTAHKSKGLEFDTVFILNAVDTAWGERARSRSRMISYPENLPLAPAGESSDERLRLFYVAATRAKRQLHISYSLHDDRGKATLPASFLLGGDWHEQPIPPVSGTIEQATSAAELHWYEPVIQPITSDMHDVLRPILESYKLSATHFNNFLDVTRGGPQGFLVQNLLRFPQAMGPAAAYGSAIHAALQRAHAHLIATGNRRPYEDVFHDFEAALNLHRLSEADVQTFQQKGTATLQAFLDNSYDSFTVTQRPELNFAGQQAIVEGVHLTGALDLIEATGSAIVVTDYKTGKPSRSWVGKTEYEKIKLHKYRQQLLFYKVLVEHSRDFAHTTVTEGVLQFVEPTPSGAIVALRQSFTADEVAQFTQLLIAVWNRITTLNLPDTSAYDQTYKGMLAFEQALLDNSI